ncbi:MAG TPA: hypothetical protein PKU93_03645 [Candidatus Pacearchaeota archaeon]|nr:hypothetical protein [Candidatus Pacearchaeota archaeon]
MVTQQLIDYIKQQLGAGVSRDEIKNILLANNWQEADINEALASVGQSNPISESVQENIAEVQSKPNKKVKVILFIALVLIFVASSVFGYFYYFKSPQKIVEGMIKNMMEVKSLDYTGQILTQVEAMDQEDFIFLKKEVGDFSLSVNGSFDINDLDNIKLMSIISASSSFFEGKAGLETRATDNVYYFKINSIPETLVPMDLSSLENKWIKIDLNEIKNYAKESGFTEEVDEFERQQEIANEKVEQVKGAIKKANIYIVTEASNSEIDGKPAYRYKFTLSKDNIINLLLEISRIMENNSFTDEEINGFKEALKDIEMPTGEIWIGKEDLLLYRIIAKFNLNDPKSAIKTKTEMLFDFNNHNKEIGVDVPSSTKTFEEAMSELMAAALGEEAATVADIRIKSLLDQLRTRMEYLKAISSTKTYLSDPLSNADVKKISDELAEQNKKHNFAIFSNGTKWCAKASLNTSGSWCVDSAGYAGTIQNCDKNSFSCK